MGAIVLIPALICAYVLWRHSLATAVLNVYLPVLLLLPDYFRWELPGIPDPTFAEATLVPIALVFAWQVMPQWRWSLVDVLLLALMGTMVASEYRAAGYSEAQNFAFNLICMCILPYALAKGVILRQGLQVVAGRRLVLLLAAVILLSLYEFRFGQDPFRDIFQPLFPTQPAVWSTQLRWGYARIAGPFGSAILASTVFTIGVLVQFWLVSIRGWDGLSRDGLTNPGARRNFWLSVSLLLGVSLTMSRGPWMGLIFSAAVGQIGRAKHLKRVFFLMLVGVVLLGGSLTALIYNYASVGRAAAKSDEQETAAYRKELLDKYQDIAIRGGALGYGRLTWPKVSGMPSVDNYYLLMDLMHGYVALGLFLLLLFAAMTRVVRAAFRARQSGTGDTVLPFTILGSILTVAISIATVYLDMQLMTLLYLFIGWGEGYAMYTVPAEAAEPEAQLPFRFRKVLT